MHHADRGMSNTVRTTQVVAAGSIACFSAARHGGDTLHIGKHSRMVSVRAHGRYAEHRHGAGQHSCRFRHLFCAVDTARDHCSRAYAACAGRAGSVKQLAAFGLAQATKANGACNHAAHSAQGGNKDMLMLEVSPSGELTDQPSEAGRHAHVIR